MNWNLQDLSETYPIIRDSILTDTEMEIALAILDMRVVVPINGYSKDLMHPSTGSDAFRATITGLSNQYLTVEVFCPVAEMTYNTGIISVPLIQKGSNPAFDEPSYAIVEPELLNMGSVSNLSLTVHEDCLVFVQYAPVLKWGGNTLETLDFKSTTIAPVSYQNDKVSFNGAFSDSIPSFKMLDIEKKYSSKGLRSINGVTDIVNIATLNDVEATVEREEGSKVTTLTIKPVL